MRAVKPEFSFNYTAIILAAGKATRFKTNATQESKIWALWNNKPLFMNSLEAFSADLACQEIILVVHKDDLKAVKTHCHELVSSKLIILLGGSTRFLSTKKAVIKAKSAVLMIHDAARPNISAAFLDAFKQNCHSRCVIAAQRTTDTIKQISPRGKVLLTLNRHELVNAQTPQFFYRSDLIMAYQQYHGEKTLTIFDESTLIEKFTPYTVQCWLHNFFNPKITYNYDLNVNHKT